MPIHLGGVRAATHIMRTLGRREAVISSQIEGTGSDIDDVLKFEVSGNDEGLPSDVVVTFSYVKEPTDMRKYSSSQPANCNVPPSGPA